MLGQILEVVTGETSASLLAKHIFAPLGMKDTYLGIDTAQPLEGMHAAIAFTMARGSRKKTRCNGRPRRVSSAP